MDKFSGSLVVQYMYDKTAQLDSANERTTSVSIWMNNGKPGLVSSVLQAIVCENHMGRRMILTAADCWEAETRGQHSWGGLLTSPRSLLVNYRSHRFSTMGAIINSVKSRGCDHNNNRHRPLSPAIAIREQTRKTKIKFKVLWRRRLRQNRSL